jgi:hypothetical protein
MSPQSQLIAPESQVAEEEEDYEKTIFIHSQYNK